jgi:hypothetical protein
LQQLSVAHKTPSTSFSVGQELHGYVVKEVEEDQMNSSYIFSLGHSGA